MGTSGTHSCGPRKVQFSCESLGASWDSSPMLPGPRSSPGVEARNLCFLSCADMDLGVPLEFQQWNQCSSHVDTCKSTFLTNCNSSVRLPVKLT